MVQYAYIFHRRQAEAPRRCDVTLPGRFKTSDGGDDGGEPSTINDQRCCEGQLCGLGWFCRCEGVE